MFAHSSAATVAASISAAPPVSVFRKSLTGAARFRPQAVFCENGSRGAGAQRHALLHEGAVGRVMGTFLAGRRPERGAG